MAFLFVVVVLATKVKEKHFKKREEDIVISAFICSDTGELAKQYLSGFPQELQTIF